MQREEILNRIDHTMLKATATWEDITKLCEEAVKYHTASVCIPPCYVKRVKETYQNRLVICTVIGFPLGYMTESVKAAEAKQALEDGADEIDMVINLTDLKNKEFDKVEEEIRTLKKLANDRVLKVIIETCYLTTEEKKILCKAVTNAGADFIKTSTGFGSAGASLEDIELFKENIGSSVKIKAAGGIRTREDMETYIKAGCERIGTSAATRLMED